jgi:hypothetical protein
MDLIHPATEAALSPFPSSTKKQPARMGRIQAPAGMPRIELPLYDEGGQVDVADGQHQLAILKDGERVLTPEEAAAQDRQAAPAPLIAEKSPEDRAIETDKKNAMGQGPKGLLNLGTALIHEKQIDGMKRIGAPEPTPTLDNAPLNMRRIPAMSDVIAPPPFSSDLISTRSRIPGLQRIELSPTGTTETAPLIPTKDTGSDLTPSHREKLADYDSRIQAAYDEGTPEGREKALLLQEAKQNYLKSTPWGSTTNHPGILGKLGHISEMIASRTPGLAPIMATIPGSEGYRAAQRHAIETAIPAAEQETTARAKEENEVDKDTPEQKTTRALLEKGYVLGKDAQGNPVLNEVPGYRDSSKDMQALLASTVQDVTARGGDPSADPTVQRITKVMQSLQKPEKEDDFAAFYPKWLKDHHNAPDNSHNEELARKAWQESGQAPPQVLLMQPNAQGGQTATVVKPGTTVSPEATKPGEEAKTREKTQKVFDTGYKKPADAVEKSYNMMDHAYQEYEAARAQGKDLPTGAQSMVALSTHLSTTFGNVKGSRITKDMIQEHLGARGISDKALVAFQKLTNGDVLSPDQWEAFHNLIAESRKLSWQTAVREANRKHLPIDFLPDDLTAVKQGHAVSTIHTSWVQDFLKKYPDGIVLSGKE